MDHGSHAGHGDMNMGMNMKCSMNMLWNSQISGTCVVFESWHISNWWGMMFSCIAIALISFLYSLLLSRIRSSDRRIAIQLYVSQTSSSSNLGPNASTGLLSGRESPVAGERSGGNRSGGVGMTKLPQSIRVTRALTYALSVAISFFLMLVAMTYNTYLFASIIVGAGVGHFWTEDEMDVGAVLSGAGGKGLACH